MITSAGRRSLVDRMIGAALLEPDTFEEAALAPSVRTQAAIVVIITSIAAGLGSLSAGLVGFVAVTVSAFVGWGLYAFVTYRIATVRFGVPATYSVMSAALRVLGLASTPRLFLVLAFVPGIGLLLGLVVHAWVVIATVPAVKAAFEIDSRRAIVTAVAGSLPMLALWVLVRSLV